MPESVNDRQAMVQFIEGLALSGRCTDGCPRL